VDCKGHGQTFLQGQVDALERVDLRGLRVGVIQGAACGFDGFTYPRYRAMLLGAELAQFMHERIAVGAWLDDRPVGLAFFSRPYSPLPQAVDGEAAAPFAVRECVGDADDARSIALHCEPDASASSPSAEVANTDRRQLLSIMVEPLLRRCGIAGRLISHAEQLALASGTRRLNAIHSSRLSARLAFEALLARSGWSAPAEFQFRLAGRARGALQAQADWAPFLARLAARGFTSTSWVNLGDADRAAQRQLVAQVLPEADRRFDPFHPRNRLAPVPELSVMLRRHGRIVGWIQGSQGTLPDSFHYSYGYALPEVQRLGWLAAGVRDVCHRQAELHGENSLCVMETDHDNAAMRRFMARQLVPYSEWADSRYLSEKQLA